MYVLATIVLPILAFGNPLENKKALEANKARIADIVDVQEPTLKKEIASLQESLSLKKENLPEIVRLKNDNMSISYIDALEINMKDEKPKRQGHVLKLTKNLNHNDSKN